MKKGYRRVGGRALFTVLTLCVALPSLAQTPRSPVVIWQERGDASALDLVGGPGGKAHEPGNVLQFIEESDGGTSPKFEVEDEHGVRWKVKLGEEAKSETAATRLLWAAGYVVDEDYYRPADPRPGIATSSPAGRSSSQPVTPSPGRGWSARVAEAAKRRPRGAGTTIPSSARASSMGSR